MSRETKRKKKRNTDYHVEIECAQVMLVKLNDGLNIRTVFIHFYFRSGFRNEILF